MPVCPVSGGSCDFLRRWLPRTMRTVTSVLTLAIRQATDDGRRTYQVRVTHGRQMNVHDSERFADF